MSHSTITVFLSAMVLAGCSAASLPDDVGDPLPDKFDTGYYSNLAMEIEGEFTATLALDLSEMTELERDIERRTVENAPWYVAELVDSQIKLAKNQLNDELLHLNLTPDAVEVRSVEFEGTTLNVRYSVTTETLVSIEELRAQGIEPDTLVNRTYEVAVAADPRNLVERLGDSCATGFKEGKLAEHNYFYYFDPDKPGCDVALAADAEFVTRSLLPQEDKYPEYDRLTADGVIDVVIFFGAAGHEDTVPDNDSGMIEWRDMDRSLRWMGFLPTDLEVGVRWTRERAGLLEVVDVISPRDLNALSEDTNGLFTSQLQSKEIVIYNGHSFYGSLDVLDDRDNFAQDTYQILLMNSCWSYEYYTKQVLQNKATDADPKGWRNIDVINDTEAGWFHNLEEMTTIVLGNVFAGAESGGIDKFDRHFSWQSIVGQMNDQAIRAQRERGTETHEIFGVSGVRTNEYQPE